MKRKFIDIEPTWGQLLNVVERGGMKPEALRPACILADEIRQVQKKGAKSIMLTFSRNGKVKLKRVM